MSILTKLNVFTRDGQNYTETVSFYITPLAFNTAQDLPTTTLIQAFITAAFADSGKLSTSVVDGYSVEVINDLSASPLGGTGIVATAIAAKTRNGIGTVGPVSPLGQPEGIELRFPGLNKGAALFDPVDVNSIVTSSANIPAIRTALVALGYQDDQGNVIGSGAIIESAIAFNGKRAPKRAR